MRSLQIGLGLAFLFSLTSVALASYPYTVDSSVSACDPQSPGHCLKPNLDGSINVSGGTGGGPATIADGADVAEGTTSDVAWASGAGTLISIDKALDRDLLLLSAKFPATLGIKTAAGSISIAPASDATFIVTNSGTFAVQATEAGTWNIATVTAVTAISNALPAGTNLLGKTGIDQTMPGSTNNVTLSTNVGTLPLVQTTASAAVSTSSAATLQVIAASGSTVIRVTQWELVTTLANNVTWESADTGGSCANPVALTGAMPFAANGGVSAGTGLGPILVLPSGKALCMLTSAATQISGSVAYAQF